MSEDFVMPPKKVKRCIIVIKQKPTEPINHYDYDKCDGYDDDELEEEEE